MYKACDEFTYQMLVHMEIFIVTPGEVLVSASSRFKQLYFVRRGGIMVTDKKGNFLTMYG